MATREGQVRLTGLFPTKRGGMWTGTMRQAEMEQLADIVNAALNAGKQLTAILFSNQEGKAEYTIYLGPDDRQARGFGNEARGTSGVTRTAERPQRDRGAVPAREERVTRPTVRRAPAEAANPDDLPF